MPPDLALSSTLNGSNYPCLELIFMVPKVFEPLMFDCMVFQSNKNSYPWHCCSGERLQMIHALLSPSEMDESHINLHFPG